MPVPRVTPKIDRVPNIYRVAIGKDYKKIMYEREYIKIFVLFLKFLYHLTAVEEQSAKTAPGKIHRTSLRIRISPTAFA